MGLRAAICESNSEKCAYIKSAFDSIDLDIDVVEFHDVYDFKESLGPSATAYDIVIFNTTIRKEGDGIELAQYLRQINNSVMIIFSTESREYYPEAFEVFATGYLIFPFDVKNLQNCIMFFYRKSQKERRASWMIKERAGNYRRIFCRNILYVESANRELIIHLEDGSTIECYGKLNQAEEALPKSGFLRCHQSYIINMYFVEENSSSNFVVEGIDIPISRKYQKIAKDVYYNYMFSKM